MHRAGGPPEWGRLSLPSTARRASMLSGPWRDSDSHPAPAPDPIGPLRHVLLATDLSPASTPATEEAMAIARRTWCAPDRPERRRPAHPAVAGRTVPCDGWIRSRHASRRRSRSWPCARVAGIPTTFLVWHGDPSEVILEAAEAEDVDLVVMGSHGRGRLGRLVLGSTSARVSAESRRRVLVVQS